MEDQATYSPNSTAPLVDRPLVVGERGIPSELVDVRIDGKVIFQFQGRDQFFITENKEDFIKAHFWLQRAFECLNSNAKYLE